MNLPPASFGTRDNPYSSMLVDAVTSNPVIATILMAYFTRAGDQLEFKTLGDHEIVEKYQLDSTPFR